MKIEYQHDEGDLVLRAEPEDYDGWPPAQTFRVSGGERASADVLAVAAYLVFGRYTSGAFVLPCRIRVELAEAIEADAHPVRVRPYPVSLTPTAFPHDSRRTVGVAEPPESNARVFSEFARREFSLRPHVAAALLSGQTFATGTVVVDAGPTSGGVPDVAERRAIESLLAAVGLSFELVDNELMEEQREP
ncbi:hypothetical protein [Brevibacterium litoralis]|uniref:hypothetical protein n=1 Tax=Brevibacterium litoralis TaxID=3138935 RepID=UPI0032EED430